MQTAPTSIKSPYNDYFRIYQMTVSLQYEKKFNIDLRVIFTGLQHPCYFAIKYHKNIHAGATCMPWSAAYSIL